MCLPDDKFRISCNQAGPGGRFTQFLSSEISPAIFERESAPARTFVYYEDVQPLMEKNLIKGGSLENAIVVRGDSVLSKEPLRFPDEFVSHKILDISGHLARLGLRIRGHIIAGKTAHSATDAPARDLRPQQGPPTAPPAPGRPRTAGAASSAHSPVDRNNR